ncbi:hypothetical protein KPH14_002794 [Odynerus spinipes]|uniref:WAP domain-containing protein n=1 Tax=Odynerus spinipes TaxID=1348599 RepID=A0AAD9VQ87_9HYME|nr:hypothetical protein KPH14_002794 [Odynerus spinipes]
MASSLASMLLLITLSAMAFALNKPGTCPPRGPLGICAIICNDDQDCVGNQKCCTTACGGTTCLIPVSETNNVVKQGSCPARPTGRWTCSSTCRSDGDCRGNKKCCKNRCGAMVCQNPVIEDPRDLDDGVPPALIRGNNE